MATVTIVLAGDDSRLQAAHERLFRAQEKALENYQKSVSKSKEAQAQASADAELRKKAVEAEKQRIATVEKGQKLVENQRDALQKYNDEIAEAERLHKAGAITAADLAKRIDILGNELEEATGEAKRHSDMMKRGQEVTRASLGPTDQYKVKLRELIALHKAGAIDAATFANAQKKIKDELRGAESASGTVASNIAEMATAYGVVELAASGFNALLSEQVELQRKSLETSQELASAQSDAVKNLIGLNFAESGALLKEAEGIATRTGFGDRAKITQALGASVSAGATPEQAISAVESSAKLNKQTPDQLGAMAAGAVDIARSTGIDDAKQNIGFASDIQAVSRIERLDKLQTAIAKVLVTSVATMPGVEKAEASRQSGALLATLNTLANDVQGDSTATAQVQLETYTQKFFDSAGLKDATEKIQRLEAKAEITPTEAIAIQSAQKKVDTTRGPEREKAEAKLADVKARATLTEPEQEKLAKLKEQQAQYASIEDPGDLIGRIKAIQQADEATRQRFLENMPGEAVFKKPIELIFTKGSEGASMFEQNLPKIDFNADTFTQQESRIKTATPQLAVADLRATAKSNTTGVDLNPRQQIAGTAKEILDETIPKARSGNTAFATIQQVTDFLSTPFRNAAMTTPEGAIATSESILTKRRNRLVEEAMTNPFDARTFDPNSQAADQIRFIDKQLEVLQKLDDVLTRAGTKFEKAADKQINAADAKQLPQPIGPTARAQADTANR